MNIRGRETFEAGGKSFNYIPCLNDEESWVDFLVNASKDKRDLKSIKIPFLINLWEV